VEAFVLAQPDVCLVGPMSAEQAAVNAAVLSIVASEHEIPLARLGTLLLQRCPPAKAYVTRTHGRGISGFRDLVCSPALRDSVCVTQTVEGVKVRLAHNPVPGSVRQAAQREGEGRDTPSQAAATADAAAEAARKSLENQKGQEAEAERKRAGQDQRAEEATSAAAKEAEETAHVNAEEEEAERKRKEERKAAKAQRKAEEALVKAHERNGKADVAQQRAEAKAVALAAEEAKAEERKRVAAEQKKEEKERRRKEVHTPSTEHQSSSVHVLIKM